MSRAASVLVLCLGLTGAFTVGGCEWIGGIEEKPLATCEPGAHRCNTDQRETCNVEGTAFIDDPCDAERPICDGIGRCVECVGTVLDDVTAGDCFGRVCNEGQVEVVVDDGDVLQVAGDCLRASCSNGAALTVPDDSDFQDDGDACTHQECVDGALVLTPTPDGVVCELTPGHSDANVCVRQGGGALSCTGSNSSGQLALGSADLDPHPAPTPIDGLPPVVGARLGGETVFAWTSDGTLYGWGRNDEGQVEPGGPATIPTPQKIVITAPKEGPLAICGVAAHRHSSCARSCDGRLACWGRNDEGQLGNGTLTPVSAPTFVVDPADPQGQLRDVIDVDVGEHHACALRAGGTLRCWGRAPLVGNGSPQGAPPISISSKVPVADLDAVALGAANTCVHKESGSIYCWGADDAGQITAETGPIVTSPTPLPAIDFVGFGGVGDRSVCVLEPGKVACWGAAERGQLGVDDGCSASCDTFFHDPVTPMNLAFVRQLVVHAGHACALVNSVVNSGVYCWGDNLSGQLGTTAAPWFETVVPVPF